MCVRVYLSSLTQSYLYSPPYHADSSQLVKNKNGTFAVRGIAHNTNSAQSVPLPARGIESSTPQVARDASLKLKYIPMPEYVYQGDPYPQKFPIPSAKVPNHHSASNGNVNIGQVPRPGPMIPMPFPYHQHTPMPPTYPILGNPYPPMQYPYSNPRYPNMTPVWNPSPSNGITAAWIHKEDKEYKCGMCTKAYKSKESLGRHLKAHNQEKKYKCIQCDALFMERYLLERHMTVHSSDKPFTCQYCTRKFARKSYLQKHMKNIHAIITRQQYHRMRSMQGYIVSQY